VGVNNRQIGFISTHRKIGHSPSIKWYQLSRLIGEFYLVFSPFLQSTKNQQKIYFRLDLFPATF
jgi:hypothetical protein